MSSPVLGTSSTATCPSGKSVIGGGWEYPDNTASVFTTRPNGQTWSVSAQSPGGFGSQMTLTAYVICATGEPVRAPSRRVAVVVAAVAVVGVVGFAGVAIAASDNLRGKACVRKGDNQVRYAARKSDPCAYYELGVVWGGQTGETGPSGETGETGARGVGGPDGEPGATGEAGPAGPSGSRGAPGPVGPAGPAPAGRG